jgi:hypothetical protein
VSLPDKDLARLEETRIRIPASVIHIPRAISVIKLGPRCSQELVVGNMNSTYLVVQAAKP